MTPTPDFTVMLLFNAEYLKRYEIGSFNGHTTYLTQSVTQSLQ